MRNCTHKKPLNVGFMNEHFFAQIFPEKFFGDKRKKFRKIAKD